MNRSLHLLVVCLVVGLTACDKKSEHVFPKTGYEATGAEARSAAGTAQTSSLEREHFLVRAGQEAAELERKIEVARKQLQQSTGEAKAKLAGEMPVLDREMKDLKAKLLELKTAAVDKWKDSKVAFENAMDRLRVSVARVNESPVSNHYP